MGIKTRNFANNILSGGTIDGTDFLSGTLPSSNITNDSAASVTSIPSISNVVSTVAGDPPSPTLGDIWYNSSTNALKFQGFQAAAWSTGGNLPTGTRLSTGFGTQSAAVSAGGAPPSPSGPATGEVNTFEYNGSSWTAGNNLPIGFYNAGGTGTQTSGLQAGGNESPNIRSDKSFEYDGTSWTAGGTMSAYREGVGLFGTQTTGLAYGGESLTPAVAVVSTIEKYNGTSWTSGNSMSNTRYINIGVGTQTAGVAFGTSPATTATELYDGTSWTSDGTTPPAQISQQGASGIQTSALLICGQNPSPSIVSYYDGSTFSAAPSVSTARAQGSAGKAESNNETSLFFGGYDGSSPVANTEEFTGEGPTAKTFTTD